MRSTILLCLTLVLFAPNGLAQNKGRIGQRLEKLYRNGKYEKCLVRATRFQRKHPQLDVPKYYISKVHWQEYRLDSLAGKSAYAHLTGAVRYADRLPENYDDYKLMVRNTLKLYVLTNYDTAGNSEANKKALLFYVRTYRDTLDIYHDYYPAKDAVIQHLPHLFQSKSDSLRYELVNFAQKLEGTRYKYAGEKPETGFDCSGFTKYAFQHMGVDLPHNAHQQSKTDGENKSLEKAKVGDLIFFGSGSGAKYHVQHAGIIYSVDNQEIKVIHCVSGGVSIEGNHSGFDMYWKDKVLFVKTLPLFQEN